MIAEASHEELASLSRPKLYGILSIYREFVPDFAALTEDLRLLLSDDSLEWEVSHT